MVPLLLLGEGAGDEVKTGFSFKDKIQGNEVTELFFPFSS
jgi:hypothetical protein